MEKALEMKTLSEDLDDVIIESLDYGNRYMGLGRVADYIPALSKADASQLGITVLTCDGQYHTGGDWEQLFTLQSVAKVMLLVYALKELGQERVFSRVGVEPTGDSFNSIVKLETKGNHPLNPFINAGAIAIMSLILEHGRTFSDFMSFLGKTLGREHLEIDEVVYLSEVETGNLNRSLAFFMKANDVIKSDVEVTLDAYFKMCSVLANTKDLARFGMILANDGVDLFTNEQILDAYNTSLVKTLMVTCGMYDNSGEFAIKVGMPAKSGVGGGILTLAQSKAGIGVFSPALDEKGNSLSGIKALEYMSWSLDLHYFKGSH